MNNNELLKASLDKMKYFNYKKKHDYASGLEQQVHWKKNIKRF